MAFGDVDELPEVVDAESRVRDRGGPGKGRKQPRASLVEIKTGEDTDAWQGKRPFRVSP